MSDIKEMEVYTERQTPFSFENGLALLPVEQQNQVLAEYTERDNNFRQWLLKQLKPGIHYGFPPGCEVKLDKDGNMMVYSRKKGWVSVPRKQWMAKPSLYKAGALYLCKLLKFKQVYKTDLDAWRMLGEPKGTVVRTCYLEAPNGNIVGEGTGVFEVGHNGMNANSTVKMADKSAVVAAVINALGLSDLLTQDIEDLGDKKDDVEDETTPEKEAERDPESVAEFEREATSWVKSTRMPYTPNQDDFQEIRRVLFKWCPEQSRKSVKDAIKWLKENMTVSPVEGESGEIVGVQIKKKA